MCALLLFLRCASVSLLETDFARRKKTPTDEVPLRMLELGIDLLREEQLSDMVASGVWEMCGHAAIGRPAVAQRAWELGLCDLAAAQLREMGLAATLSLSCGDSCLRATGLMLALSNCTMFCAEQDKVAGADAMAGSGIFELVLEGITTFASRGAEALPDTHHGAAFQFLSLTHKLSNIMSGCEAKIRGIASSLAFALEHPLPCVSDTGHDTGASATQICEPRTCHLPGFAIASI